MHVGHLHIVNFSHGYLMDKDSPDMASVCGKCYDAILTVKHVVLECPIVRHERAVLGDNPTLEKMLIGDDVKNVMQFLKAVNIYKYI